MVALKRKVAASTKKTRLMLWDEARKPAAAKPTAVEPNWAMAMIALAAPSSSSLAISGSTLSLAGEKNWVTDAESMTITYSQMMFRLTMNGMVATSPARSRSAVIMIALRLNRSTTIPAIRPKISVGTAVAISISPTLRADPVRW